MRRFWLLAVVGMLFGLSCSADEPGAPPVANTVRDDLAGAGIEIPDGAYDGAEPITVAAGATIATALPGDSALIVRAVGPAVKFGPPGTVFDRPVTLSVPFSVREYNEAELSGRSIAVLSQSDGSEVGFEIGPVGLESVGFEIGPVGLEVVGFEIGPVGIEQNRPGALFDALFVFPVEHFTTYQVVVVGSELEPDTEPECGDDEPCPDHGVCTDGVCGPCVAQCVGKQCGDDGCGRLCGVCSDNLVCEAGQCAEMICEPQCEDLECGDDGCGDTCGACDDTEVCVEGLCVDGPCESLCDGKECGDDGCEGTCGDCLDGMVCVEGQCTTICVPDCGTAECGDDGCGGSCGLCADGQLCENGACAAPCTPSCEAKTCGDDGCDGSCGECGDNQVCDIGVCVCKPDCDGKECGDDGCGFTCGTCEYSAATCDDNGQCQCEPQCKEKNCGPDGCGGECGNCDSSKEFCNPGGVCECVPSCAPNTCGVDGCGGNCGPCDAGYECQGDVCTLAPPTCSGFCGGIASSGCNCAPGCAAAGDCCPDYCDFCAKDDPQGCCTPACQVGNEGAPNGCGGFCGDGAACDEATFKGSCYDNTVVECVTGLIAVYSCEATFQQCWVDPQGVPGCVDCVPNCAGQDDTMPDGCGGYCGTGKKCLASSCKGDLAVDCQDGFQTIYDCAGSAMVCQLVDQNAVCMPCEPDCTGKPNGADDGCGGFCENACPIAEIGMCEGTVLHTCDATGIVVSYDCAIEKKTCEMDPAGAKCVDAVIVCPQCNGKQPFEDDGCGGQCPDLCSKGPTTAVCAGNNQLLYCDAGFIGQEDCAANGMDCVDATGPAGPAATCEGGT